MLFVGLGTIGLGSLGAFPSEKTVLASPCCAREMQGLVCPGRHAGSDSHGGCSSGPRVGTGPHPLTDFQTWP